MTSNELRQKFISFFVSKGHEQIPSASLVPENDPSVLFTTAGMHPLVPYLMGEEHPAGKRLVNAQKCVRTGDIDEVGDDSHLTFFEMLGNWSLGDYFKEDAIRWSFEFLTEELGIGIDDLAVSVFAGDEDAPFDEEAFKVWRELGVSESRIAKLGKGDNWWPAGGKHPGPQGPDTEMFYWTGEGDAPEVFDAEDERWMEIWNDVFMEFNEVGDGLQPLEKKNVDTGMGFERVVAVLQGKKSVFETDVFAGIFEAIRSVCTEDCGPDNESARIVADHVRSAVMMVSDGVMPSNKDQGYILRRLIRRSIRHAKHLGVEGRDLMEPVCDAVVASLGDAYPSLKEQRNAIVDTLIAEAEKFGKTLEKGLRQFEKIFDKKGGLDGNDAFDLYQSFGFPLELTEELAAEKGQHVDREVFEKEFKVHQEKSRAGAGQKFAGGLADDSVETTRLHTATHLVHQALRTVLGDHVGQKGSNITKERLRFDFSHSEKMTDEQKLDVEKIVNEVIQKAFPVRYELMTVEEAKAAQAIGFFEDTYAQLDGKVKVYFIGDDALGYASREICGGPHVQNTSELGSGFRITKEQSCSQGVRRIKAILE